jgi:hypothetical protein
VIKSRLKILNYKKKMQTLKFDLTMFEDLLTYKLTNIQSALFDFMKDEIEKENKIIIERRSINADSVEYQVIKSKDELDQFIKIYNSEIF